MLLGETFWIGRFGGFEFQKLAYGSFTVRI